MLSDAKLRKINGIPISKRIEIADTNGLSVRVTPNGVVIFQYRYRFAGTPRRMTLGTYGELTLKDARERVRDARKVLESGRDPIIARSMELTETQSSPSVSACIAAWLGSAPAKKLVKREFITKALERHIIPYVGEMIVKDMTIAHWLPVFKRMRENGAETFAGMLLSRQKQIFSYCVRIGMINVNPLTELRAKDVGTPVVNRKRYFDDNEIGLFWQAIDKSSIAFQNKLMLKLLLLTGCRGVEIRKATKSEFDLFNRTWRVPIEHSKTKEPFARGLSKDAAAIFSEAFNLYPNLKQVFPPASVQEDRAMAASVLLNLARLVRNHMGIHDWAIHDLRRTVKTKMSELGVMPHVSEKVLGHKLGGVLAVYDQHAYLKEQQDACDLWASHIHVCFKSTKP